MYEMLRSGRLVPGPADPEEAEALLWRMRIAAMKARVVEANRPKDWYGRRLVLPDDASTGGAR